MKIILSLNGYPIQVSDEDYDHLTQWNWSVSSHNGRIAHVKRDATTMIAHEIFKYRQLQFELIDHKDRNTLNNQFENLRAATLAQNMANFGLRPDNTQGYKGVNFHKRCNRFVARIQVNGQRLSLGYFEDAQDAARAYDQAARRYHGEFAVLNFSES